MRKALSFCLLAISLILSSTAWAQKFVERDFERLSSGDVFEVDAMKLHPTQMRVGNQQIESRLDEEKHFSPHEWNKFLKENPIPVVIGPGGQLYMVDHHHQTIEAYKMGQGKVIAEVIENLHDMSWEEFWEKMVQNNWTYLYDNVEDRPVAPEELPKTILEMRDDPYRSLAWLLKKAHGYAKDAAAFFIEFKWGKALKKHFDEIGIEPKSHWGKQEVEAALKFAKSSEAIGLPGSQAKAPRCSAIY